jgi:membrane protease YdiL (CAAX protease family)
VSDDETRLAADEPLEPILLPDNPYASPRVPVAPPSEPAGSPRRPRIWTVWLVFVVSQVANIAAVIVLLLLLAAWEHGPTAFSPGRVNRALLEVSQGLVGLLSTLSATMIVFAGAAVTAAVFSPVEWRQRLRLRRARISTFGVLLHIGGVLAIGLVFGALIALGLLPESGSLAELTEIVAGLSGGALAVTVLVMGIAPGVAEELLFRGYIQTRFSRRWGPGWGVLWTSLLFGAMHLDFVQGAFAFALGIYLGYLTEWTGSIVPAMICHAANNTYSTLATAWGINVAGTRGNVFALVVGLFILIVCIRHLRTYIKPNGRDTS